LNNSEKLETLGTQNTRRQTKQKTQQHMCWTPLCANKETIINMKDLSAAFRLKSVNFPIRIRVYVYEDEGLSNFTLKHKLKLRKATLLMYSLNDILTWKTLSSLHFIHVKISNKLWLP
jgi:hypothetical protein